MRNTRNFLLTPLATLVCVGFSISAQAQVLDEVEWLQEGADAVVVVEFFTPVQFTNAISARASDLVQVFYNIIPTLNDISLSSAEQRLPGGAGLPTVIVRDEAVTTTTQVAVSRKLVVSFSTPTRFKVRPGRIHKDGRGIELVLEGLGSFVPTLAVKTTKARPVVPATSTPAESGVSPSQVGVENQASALLAAAQSAFDGGQYDGATESLNKLLNLPPNNSSRKAQELAGLARLNAGDQSRAAAEFGLFLKLYPEGADSDRVRQLLANMPSSAAVTPTQPQTTAEAKGVTSGSVSSYYYGGKTTDQTRKEAYLANNQPAPTEAPTATLVEQKQLQTSVDLSWRLRDAEKDMRIVFRDAYTTDYLKTSKSKERLSAMYVDYKSLTLGSSVRVGRQSPSGGGVMYRFDGIQAGYAFKPKWKVNAVMGKPSDALMDTQRSFYGVSVDAEALTKELSGSAFLIEQIIDGQTDRRGIGADLRYFKGGVSASAQIDYDQKFKELNVAAFQSNWQVTEASSFNAMLDRRTIPLLTLGNSIFYSFSDPITGSPLPMANRLQDRLDVFPMAALQQRVIAETPYQNQFQIGGTTTLTPRWQTGASFGVSSVDAIPDFIFEGQTIQGQPASGNQWNVSAQLIGINLYSSRDTHVFNVSLMGSITDHGALFSYNNLTSLGDKWQLQPSLKYYTSSHTTNGDTDTWTAGVRGVYRVRQQISLETELTYERSQTAGLPTVDLSTGAITRADLSRSGVTYYVGARYEF